jgi:hypothetical protein
VVHSNGTITSLGYNVSDKASGTNATDSGFTFVTGDKTLTAPTTAPVDPANATHPFVSTTEASSDITIVPSSLTNYPAEDFYGTALPVSGTIPAGAVWQ